MKYRTINSEFYCGVDVHPKRSRLCILDNTGKQYLNRNIVNNFDNFKEFLNPFYRILWSDVNPLTATTGWLMAVINIGSHSTWDMLSI